MKRSKALAIALFAAVVAMVSLSSSATAGSGATFAVGDKIMKSDGTNKHTVTTVDNAKDSAKATRDSDRKVVCFTDVQPTGAALNTPWRLRSKTGPKVWTYTCPTAVKLKTGTLSRAWG